MQALLALERLGLDPARDQLRLQVIGPQAQLAKALEAGVVDATVLPPAFSRPLKRRGFPVLLEVKNTNIPLTVNSLIALRDSGEASSPVIIEPVLKGLLRGLTFIHQPANRQAVVEILERRMRVARPAAEEAYLEAVETLDRKPYPEGRPGAPGRRRRRRAGAGGDGHPPRPRALHRRGAAAARGLGEPRRATRGNAYSGGVILPGTRGITVPASRPWRSCRHRSRRALRATP